jgi:hypothetical protein
MRQTKDIKTKNINLLGLYKSLHKRFRRGSKISRKECRKTDDELTYAH